MQLFWGANVREPCLYSTYCKRCPMRPCYFCEHLQLEYFFQELRIKALQRIANFSHIIDFIVPTMLTVRNIPKRASPPTQDNPNRAKSDQIKRYPGLNRHLCPWCPEGNRKSPTLPSEMTKENHVFLDHPRGGVKVWGAREKGIIVTLSLIIFFIKNYIIVAYLASRVIIKDCGPMVLGSWGEGQRAWPGNTRRGIFIFTELYRKWELIILVVKWSKSPGITVATCENIALKKLVSLTGITSSVGIAYSNPTWEWKH